MLFVLGQVPRGTAMSAVAAISGDVDSGVDSTSRHVDQWQPFVHTRGHATSLTGRYRCGRQ